MKCPFHADRFGPMISNEEKSTALAGNNFDKLMIKYNK